MINIKYMSISVKNIDESVKFYKLLDFEVVDEYYGDELSMVTLSDGHIKLELIKDDNLAEGFNNIGMEVENLQDVMENLENEGCVFETKIINDDFKVASLRDNDNVLINLVEK